MQRASFDPGLTQQFTGPLRRIINKDGTFNVHRRGTTWRDVHPYLHLINMRWPAFLATVFFSYLIVNTIFAAIYFLIGNAQLQGADAPTAWGRFLNEFFFSAQTLTTVGYGSISPKGVAAQTLAAFESMVGVLGFAVATGLLFGRVSRPSARVAFSENVLIAPYQDITALEFRVVNRRTNSLMEIEVRPMLMTVERENGQAKRRYQMLRLEREKVLFLPLTWTVVHPIDSESPLWEKTPEDLERVQAELLILLKAYDDTFSQTVLARHSYRHDEILWGKRFAPAFFIDEVGDLVVEVKKVGAVVG
jgi:inward rectifier potassium channel